MKNLIHPLLREGHVPGKLQKETQKRMIPLLPADGSKLQFYGRLVLKIKLFTKKILKQL